MNVPTIETNRKNQLLRNIAMMLCCVMLCSVCLLGTSSVAFCAPTTATQPGATAPAGDLNTAAGEIQTAVETMTEAIYTTMRKIITPIVIVAFGFAGFNFLLGGPQGTEKARKGVIAAIAGMAIVLFAPLFGKAVATAFMGGANDSWSNYNPL